MAKRYLILILMGIVVACTVCAISCRATVETPVPISNSSPTADATVLSDSSGSVARTPRVYEKSIPDSVTVYNPGLIFGIPGSELKFNAEIGNRIEGEVIVNEYYLKTEDFTGNPYNFDKGFVFDPYQNIIMQSDSLIKGVRDVIRVYPKGSPLHWQFAFIAATSGEYEVEAFVACTKHEYITNPPQVVGTIRVTVYEN